MKYIFAIFVIILTTIGCENKTNSNEAELIKVGYYPPFIQHFEIIANLKNKSLIFYNPSKYSIPPPPPPQKNASEKDLELRLEEHQKFINENPKIQPEYLQLNDEDINAIQKIITSFIEKDFQEDENKYPVIDGGNTNTVILLKNHKVFSIGGYVGTNTDKELELTSKIFSLFKSKSKSKINKGYIKKLERR